MTGEEILRDRIKQDYGSVKKFSEVIGIPESSIRNIFTRGLCKVTAGTLVLICRQLHLDLECLVNGQFELRPNPQKEIAWKAFCAAPDTQSVAHDFDLLDEFGKKAVKAVLATQVERVHGADNSQKKAI